jgi:hypothetical protein
MKKSNKGEKCLAIVYRIWMMRYVDVPDEIVRGLQRDAASQARTGIAKSPTLKYVPVIATVNGTSVRTTLMPAGGGRYRMQFNANLRKAANADTGDLVGVAITFDSASREVNVPQDLSGALRKRPKARKAFEKCPPGHRRQIVRWMDEAKNAAARQRRIARVIDIMLERAILGPKRK